MTQPDETSNSALATNMTSCLRCGWKIAAGEMICSKCGASASVEAESTVDPLKSAKPLAEVIEAELLHRLRTAVMGDYEVLGKIGRGGMCAVYLAHDLALDRRVAIKVVLPELISGFGIAEKRLKREARTAASLSHPNIIPVYAVGEDDVLLYFVMKYIEGRSLDTVLKRTGPLPIEIVSSILYQVGTALTYAHKRGVVHRDIKPGNIMIDKDGWAVLADFGIAKVTDSKDLTLTGSSLGTPCYMSPEQCSGQPASAAADQYSLGVVAYEMLTGTPPFVGDAIASVVTQHLFDQPSSLGERAPQAPMKLVQTVMRMLEKKPEDRWPSIKAAITHMGADLHRETDTGRARLAVILRRYPAPEGVQHVESPKSLTLTQMGKTLFKLGRKRWARQSPFERFSLLGLAVLSTIAFVTERVTRNDHLGAEPTVGIEEQINSASLEQPIVGRPSEEARTIQDSSSSANSRAGEQVSTSRELPESKPTPTPARTQRPTSTPITQQRPAVTPTPATPNETGEILLGTRGLAAVLYIDNTARGVINRLDAWEVPAGRVQLSIRADGCEPWDSTVVVDAGAQVRIGYRAPVCGDPEDEQ